jgi:hypothetical protein
MATKGIAWLLRCSRDLVPALVALAVREWLAADDVPERDMVPLFDTRQPERLQVTFRKLTAFLRATLGYPQGRWPIIKA